MKKNNKGQSTIEFILTFTAAVGFIFLFLKMAVNYTNGFMVHHAVYMASRSYLVSDSQTQQTIEGRDSAAFDLAKKVFQKNMLNIMVPHIDEQLKVNHPRVGGYIAFTGVYVDFSQIFTQGFIGGKDSINFRAESFLGREPTRVESYFQTCEAIKNIVGGSCEFHATLDDNGG